MDGHQAILQRKRAKENFVWVGDLVGDYSRGCIFGAQQSLEIKDTDYGFR